jgi:hypothetical protein
MESSAMSTVVSYRHSPMAPMVPMAPLTPPHPVPPDPLHSGPPSVEKRVEMLNLIVGSTHRLVINATGMPTPRFQWRKNGVDVPGMTSNVYTMSPVGWEDLGT